MYKTELIPYEIRRHSHKIHLYRNIKYDALKREFYQSTNISSIKEPCFLYYPLALNNIGHFIYDNAIPIYKMICIEREESLHLYQLTDRNIHIFLAQRPEETRQQQTLTSKGEQILKCFTENKIRYIFEEREDIYFDKLIICKPDLSVRPWTIYPNIKHNINSIFLKNFINQIYVHLNIKRNENPTKIIFQSRKKAKWRKITNEDTLRVQLGDKVEFVSFETLNLREELELLNNTKILIAPYGAGNISAFFLSTTSLAIIISNPNFSYRCDFPSMFINFMHHLDIKLLYYLNNKNQVELNIDETYKNYQPTSADIIERDKDMIINYENLCQLLNLKP